MDEIARRHACLVERIAAAARASGRNPTDVRCVAVSKTVGADQVRRAWEAGQTIFGENRAQELRLKTEALADLPIEWHFIGQLQLNKVKWVVPAAALIHSVDRPELAEQIAARGAPGAVQSVLLQVNTTGETSKAGVAPAELTALLDRVARLPAVRVTGLMTIGPLTDDRDQVRRAFAELRMARDRERRIERPNVDLHHLSMGMSGDFELAIAEGATLIRLGTALFGERPAA